MAKLSLMYYSSIQGAVLVFISFKGVTACCAVRIEELQLRKSGFQTQGKVTFSRLVRRPN